MRSGKLDGEINMGDGADAVDGVMATARMDGSPSKGENNENNLNLPVADDQGGQSSALLSAANGHLKGNDAFLRRVSMNFNLDRKAGNSDTSVRWVQEQMDDLDVWRAQWDYEEAVRSIETRYCPSFERRFVMLQVDKHLLPWILNKSHTLFYRYTSNVELNSSQITFHMLWIWNPIYRHQPAATPLSSSVSAKTISPDPHTCNPVQSMFDVKFVRCKDLGHTDQTK